MYFTDNRQIAAGVARNVACRVREGAVFTKRLGGIF
jgi:hypothetical protein